MNLPQPHCRHVEEGKLFLIGDRCVKMIDQPLPNRFIEFAVIPRRGDRRAVYGVSRQQDYDLVACFPHLARYRQCIAPGSLDTSLSHAAGLSDIAVCHA